MIIIGDAMLEKQIALLLKEEVIWLEKLDKGISNHNYLAKTSDATYIVRVPKVKHLKDYSLEQEINSLIVPLGINSENVAFDLKTGIKISKYIDNLKTFTEYHKNDKIKKTVRLMHTLHQANLVCSSDFNPLDKLEEYLSKINTPLFNLKPYLKIKDEIKRLSHPKILCHNDWVAGNICFTNKKSYLIDYEYAANNDPYFDVMSFLTENDLTNDQISEFLKLYFNHNLSISVLNTLKLWEKFHNLLWCSWANMMYDLTLENQFKAIALDKYTALKTTILP